MIHGQQPAAHHGEGALDPAFAALTAGGDGLDDVRPHRTWIAFVTMAVVVLGALLGWRLITGGEADARAEAASDGIVLVAPESARVQIDAVGDGYHVCVYTGTGDSGDFAETDDLCEIGPYTYRVVPTTASEAASWDAYPDAVDGLTLRWDPEAVPDPLLVVDTGDRVWRVASETRDDDAAGSFSLLLGTVTFEAAG
ncbi:hypothetical protein [Demequina subtropica]|uniref:hypothetical protein n=1 Tax=Demequina subtropica TaxID=1638989 RepID=UPI00078236F0|nr:hypothetical protein [Demequina subtropica]